MNEWSTMRFSIRRADAEVRERGGRSVKRPYLISYSMKPL